MTFKRKLDPKIHRKDQPEIDPKYCRLNEHFFLTETRPENISSSYRSRNLFKNYEFDKLLKKQLRDQSLILKCRKKSEDLLVPISWDEFNPSDNANYILDKLLKQKFRNLSPISKCRKKSEPVPESTSLDEISQPEDIADEFLENQPQDPQSQQMLEDIPKPTPKNEDQPENKPETEVNQPVSVIFQPKSYL